VLYDSLTGLANRFNISKTLDTTLAAFAQQQRSCAIMLLDLDRFKQVNDTLGHPAGDALLKQVAERLLKIVGDKEMVSRLGGDEFQIILPDQEDRGKLGDMAADIIASLSQPYSVEGRVDGERRQWRAVRAPPRFALSDRRGDPASGRPVGAAVFDHQRLYRHLIRNPPRAGPFPLRPPTDGDGHDRDEDFRAAESRS